MFKRLIALLLLVMMLVPCAAAIAASKPSNEDLQDEARLNGTNLIGGAAEVIYTGNLRSDASEYSTKVGVAIEGDVYEITGYFLNNKGRSWIRVDYNGYDCWVSASLVRCSVSNALDARYVSTSSLIGAQIRIIAGIARARSGPDTDFYTVDYVKRNETYQVLDARASSVNKIWYQIRVNGRLGWISSGIAERIGYYGNSGSSYNSYSYSGTDTTTSASTSSSSSSSSSYNNNSSYNGGYQVYPTGQTCTIIAESANARSGPGTSYRSVTTVLRGQRYTILAVDTASNGKEWYQISVGGVNCWVSSGVTNMK